jgi:gamma-glutamylcyclotransferase (GGCT)/AIG2-like uncharacterized protein YtfP
MVARCGPLAGFAVHAAIASSAVRRATRTSPSSMLNGSVAAEPTELLFSYGTLRQRDVQLATFGRELEGRLDAIIGFELDWVTITDPHVISTSGSDRHPILKPTDQRGASVAGTVFPISATELAAADDYEVDAYRRIKVPLRSGEPAWVYVFGG